jgi:hypothetical protein
MKRFIRETLRPLKTWLLRDISQSNRQATLLIGRLASWEVRSKTSISSIEDVEFKVSSQWGQDGIIDWLIERAAIARHLRTFVEFGVEDYREANTRFLLQNRNWRGLIMDGSTSAAASLKEDGLAWKHDITAQTSFLTCENINEQIIGGGFRGEIGLLSIDVDGNDYWIWEAIDAINPIVVICEYNAVFGDLHPVSVPYDPAFHRTQKHYSNLYFGASIAALCQLASRKGYRFVGTTSAANDAFFVRNDYAEKFVDQSLQSIYASPSFARESRNETGELNYIGGLDRLEQIASLPVVNVVSGAATTLGDLRPIYSATWLAEITGKQGGLPTRE